MFLGSDFAADIDDIFILADKHYEDAHYKSAHQSTFAIASIMVNLQSPHHLDLHNICFQKTFLF